MTQSYKILRIHYTEHTENKNYFSIKNKNLLQTVYYDPIFVNINK